MDSQVHSLITSHAPHLQITGDGRVKCTLNGHIMPATLVAVQAFTGYFPLLSQYRACTGSQLHRTLMLTLRAAWCSGAKFQRLKKRADEEAGFVKYEPFIIQSKNVP